MIDRIPGLDGGSAAAQADDLKERALDLTATAREQLGHWFESCRNYTREQPARALGVALGMGVLVGWLIKRR